MMRPVTIIIVMLAWLLSPVFAVADEGEELRKNKQELDRIKRQLSETEQKVDSLNQLETQIQRTIVQYGERVNLNRKLVGNMENKLKNVRREISDAAGLLTDTEHRLKQKRLAYIGLLVDYYRRDKSRNVFRSWDYDRLMTRSRMVRYLSSVSGRTTREITQVDDSIRLLAQHVDSLEQTGTDLDKKRREKTARISLDLTLKQEEETNLGNVRRQTNLLQDRLVSLSATARQMEDIIAELERAQERRRRQSGREPRYQTGSFARSKGSLPPPIKGKIVSSFGWKKNKITNLSSFSPGIDIQPSPGHADIIASAPGRVVYVGTLRGYENFVIIEHDDGFYTTYAGLGDIAVDTDELVDTGDVLGKRGKGNVHFEIREGREHLDPVIWLDMYGF